MHGRMLAVVAASALVLAGIVGSALMPTAVGAAKGPSKAAKYVGSKQCRMCHMPEYNTWRKTKHAKNFGVLKGDEVKNPDCLKCHTTGYGQPGGFVSLDKTPKLTNTGCESCHGAGSEHVVAAKKSPDEGEWAKYIDKTPQNKCVKCHNPHVNQKDRVAKLRKK